MVSEVCLKTRSNNYCSASPIVDCSCTRDGFSDPFPAVPDKLDSKSLLLDLEEVLRLAGETPAGKFKIIAQIMRLVLLPKVSVDKSFVITGLEDPAKG
jgi:hypothetical protein